jgi:hypothetical protein
MGLVGMFWNEGGAYVFHAESPEPPVPAAGRVTLEHAAPFPRHLDRPAPLASLQNEHRISIAVEPVPPGDGLAIDGADLLAAGERRRQHQERRSR